MRLLITGASGQVGSYLVEECEAFAEVHAPLRTELDLLNLGSIRKSVRDIRPDWILHPAAYTAVDQAETDRNVCFAVNTEATRVFAEEALRAKIPIVTFSTDYVFDGKADRPYLEHDQVAPMNVYGESKLAAEQALAVSGCHYINFRTSWVYSARGNNFVKSMLRLGASRPELKIVADQQGCPTSAREIAKAIAAIVNTPMFEIAEHTGTFHLAGSGATTWCGFAQHLLAEAKRLRPGTAWAETTGIPSDEYPTPARRPVNSRLDCGKLQRIFGIKLPVWTESASEVVAELLAQS